MKVILCASDYEGTSIGGPDVWINRLAHFFQKNGIQVSICFVFHGDLEKCSNVQRAKNEGFQVHLISSSVYPSTNEKIFYFVNGICKEIKPHVIVANLCVSILFSSKFLSKSNIPVVGVVHSNDDFYKAVIKEFIWTKGKFKIQHWVFVSKYLENYALSNSNKNSIKNKVISCGTRYSGIVNSPPKEILKIVYVGRFRHKQKRIFDVVESFCQAAKTIPNTQYYFYGYGPEGEEAEMLKIIRENQCESKVIIKGLVDNEKIHDELSNKHIIVLMSDFEGLPMALIEGMSVGLVPVCLREESGVNEVVEHMKNGIILENRTEDFLTAIELLKNNPLLWKRFSMESRRKIKSNYIQEVEDLKWLRLMKEIYKQNPDYNFGALGLKMRRIRLPKKNPAIPQDIRMKKKQPEWYIDLKRKTRLNYRLKVLKTWLKR